MINLREKGELSTQMETIMRGNGKKVRNADKECTTTAINLITKDLGGRIEEMVLELNSSLMALSISVNSEMTLNTVEGYFRCQTERNTMENFRMIKSQVLVILN